ncbi:hypothetical protein QUF75_03060 [Desulfococcaceae bacterium HSG7]|nr:hypothetical protein [Desulfococcaceae bacterium HSG7]
MKIKYFGVVLVCLLMVFNISASHAKNVPSNDISITVPLNVIANVIKATLPLNIEKGQYLKGALWVHTIDHIKIGSDKVTFNMNIRGKNIKFETQLGNQPLLMDIGNIDAAFNCNATLRYDASKRLLYITPHILQTQDAKKSDQKAANLLQLLSLANGVEYPIEINKIQPLVTQISDAQLNIDMDITNIHTEKDKILISIRPKVKKVKSQPSSGKKSE